MPGPAATWPGTHAVEAHPMATSQRAAVFKLLLEKLAGAGPAVVMDDGQQAALNGLNALTLPQIDQLIYRAKPRHPQPKEGMAWVWAFMYQEDAVREERAHLQSICTIRCEHAHFSQARSQDGPLLKWLLDWNRQHRLRGPGGGAEGGAGDDMDDGGGDDAEANRPRRRARQ